MNSILAAKVPDEAACAERQRQDTSTRKARKPEHFIFFFFDYPGICRKSHEAYRHRGGGRNTPTRILDRPTGGNVESVSFILVYT